MKYGIFNHKYVYKNIPDEIYNSYLEENTKLRQQKWPEFLAKLQSGGASDPFEYILVKAGEKTSIPDNVYKNIKDKVVKVSNSFNHYKDKNGNIIPYDMSEAIRHHDVNSTTEFMKTIPLFELLDENISSNNESKSQNFTRKKQ